MSVPPGMVRMVTPHCLECNSPTSERLAKQLDIFFRVVTSESKGKLLELLKVFRETQVGVLSVHHASLGLMTDQRICTGQPLSSRPWA